MGGLKMKDQEKEIWKWTIDCFSDKEIANFAQGMEIKIPGFRQINSANKNFKLLRPKLIQAICQPKNINDLKGFFQSLTNKDIQNSDDFFGKNKEELLEIIENSTIKPSWLFCLLLSSDEENDVNNAYDLFAGWKEEGKLDFLENRAGESEDRETEPEGTNQTNHEQESNYALLENDLAEALKIVKSLEKKLNKSEHKNEENKAKIATMQTSFETQKKLWKEEKKDLVHQMQTLKSELGKIKNKSIRVTTEKEEGQKKFNQQLEELKKKDAEIASLNAELLNTRTALELEKNHIENPREVTPVQTNKPVSKIKVAIIGDPKNTRVQHYQKFDLDIVEVAEIEDEKNKQVFDHADQIWVLNYKTPIRAKKRVRSLLNGRPIKEFDTFVDLENYMVKG